MSQAPTVTDETLTIARKRLSELDDWEGFEDDVFAFAPTDEPGKPTTRRALEIGGAALALLVVSLLLKTFIVGSYTVPSASMSPTLEPGDRMLVNLLAFRMGEPSVGDVVVFDRPAGAPVDDAQLVKRVTAVGGQTIESVGGSVLVDGEVLDEPYLPAGVVTGDFGPVVVSTGHVFVLGDNRSNSVDSRVFGPIMESALVGRVLVQVWPLGDLGPL